jgi:sugar/nucleoside kinase (ribokinase family)
MRSFCIFLLLLPSSLLATGGYRVLGLGAPCLDYIIHVEEHELASYGLKKGGWHKIDAAALASIVHGGKPPLVFSGSCVANTIKGMSALGISCALTGNVGVDPMGEKIRAIFRDACVTTFFTETETTSSQVACLITPDGDRSFCSFVRAEHEITEKDLKPGYFEGVELVHLSGYRLPNGNYTEKRLAMAKEAGAIVSFDLGNSRLVEEYRERLWTTIPAYVDILFANEQEAYALVQLPPKKAAAFLKNFCKIAVVKIESQGCWVCSKEGLFHSPGIPTQTVDTTGAGDLFAAGFL